MWKYSLTFSNFNKFNKIIFQNIVCKLNNIFCNIVIDKGSKYQSILLLIYFDNVKILQKYLVFYNFNNNLERVVFILII